MDKASQPAGAAAFRRVRLSLGVGAAVAGAARG
jgi:hypothetical protein